MSKMQRYKEAVILTTCRRKKLAAGRMQYNIIYGSVTSCAIA